MEDSEVNYYLKPDTALLRNNAAFYYPDFTTQLEVRICAIIRVCRLGRSIAARFAVRYYDAVGAGITFTAADLLARCKAAGKPWDAAVSFDYSAAVSREFIDIVQWRENRCPMRARGEAEIPLAFDNVQRIDSIMEYVSNFMTLKIGDYIFIPVSPPFRAHRGLHIEASLMNKKMVEVEIK
jgi:2-keto-4-pentenoate hydratase/2-oxohepta-3-ene-1,7-dioic acid hydratase in catechol pathway